MTVAYKSAVSRSDYIRAKSELQRKFPDTPHYKIAINIGVTESAITSFFGDAAGKPTVMKILKYLEGT